MGKILLALVLKYVEAHPEQIVELLGEAVQSGVHALKAHNADKVAAAAK